MKYESAKIVNGNTGGNGKKYRNFTKRLLRNTPEVNKSTNEKYIIRRITSTTLSGNSTKRNKPKRTSTKSTIVKTIRNKM
jgi:hypothetical protein